VNGKQRGTSRREDSLDTLIGLRRPADYSAEQGARFEVHIEKARSMVGDGALPFEAMVEAFVSESGKAGIRWVARDLNPPALYRAAELFRDGHTVRQVADLLGVSRSEAGRLRLKAVADGMIAGVGEDDSEDHETAVEGRFRLN
jgi:putative DNA primase/helicase